MKNPLKLLGLVLCFAGLVLAAQTGDLPTMVAQMPDDQKISPAPLAAGQLTLNASSTNGQITFRPTALTTLSIPPSGEYLTIGTKDGTLSVSLKDGSVKTTGAITMDGAAEAFWTAVTKTFPPDYTTRRRIAQLEGAMALSAMRAGYASMQALFNIEMIHARSDRTSDEDKKAFSEAMGKLVLRMREVESEIARLESDLGLKPGEEFKSNP